MADALIAQFTIKGADGEAQDVGYRVFLMTTLTGYGLEVSLPVNIPGGGVKVTVKGDEKTIRDAVIELRKTKPDVKKVGKVEVSDPVFGSYDFKPFKNKDIQLLTLNQLSKGIPAIIRMEEKIEGIGEDVGGVKVVVGGLNAKYHTISRTLNYQLVGIFLRVLMAMLGLVMLMK